MTTPSTWLVKSIYHPGERALVCGKEAMVAILPHGTGCKLCPAVTPGGHCRVNSHACTASIGSNAYWADIDLYNLERLKGNV